MISISGWQRNKGLGPPGKTGKLFPVKSALKRDRHGLGLEAEDDKLEKAQKIVLFIRSTFC